MKINYVNLGLIEYEDALKIQEKLQLLRQQNKIEDTLILLQHYPVITLGRGAKYEDILVSKEELDLHKIKIYETNRGGNVTYHGPGQIVGYIIMNLINQNKDITEFVRKICEVFIQLLKVEYNIEAGRDRGKYTGVWIGNDKITAIGISVKHWVTMHGFAFNVNTQMQHFKLINPCGLKDKGVTSLKEILNKEQDINILYEKIVYYFCKVFNVIAIKKDINSLIV
jgi:lipoyl(octanoyl) transferase